MTKEYIESSVCQKAAGWLEQCVKLNQTMFEIQKYHSEMLVNNKDSFPVYSVEDVL
jgi:hypothetical protein